MSACTPPDHAAFEAGSTRGLTPPLLPTLMMAAILGGASYLCREPAAVKAPASVSASVLASAVATAPQAIAEAPFVPASLAFASQFPLSVTTLAESTAKAQPRPARIAAPRRAETPRVVAKGPDKGPDKAHDRGPSAPGKALAASDTPPPFEAEETSVAASEEGVLPEIALPFAPTIRAVTQAGAAVGAFVGAKSAAAGAFVEVKSAVIGAETATLGAAVSGWVGRLR